MKFTNLAISCLVLLFSGTSVALAETTNEETKRLKEENDRLTERITNLEKKQDLLELKLPNLNSDIEGNIKFEGIDIENRISAYRAMDKIADKVQKEITDNLGSNVSLVFLNSDYVKSLLNSYVNYKKYKDTIEQLKKDFEELERLSKVKESIPENITIPDNVSVENRALSIASVPVVSDFIFNSLTLFRTDKEFKGASVAIADKAFIANLSNKLRQNNKGISIYNPNEYPLIMFETKKEIIEELNQLNKYVQKAQKISSGDTLEKFKAKVNELNARFTSDTNLLPSIIKYTSFNKIKSNKDGKRVYFLSVEIIAGGTSRSTRNIFTNRLRHSGGVIVNYIIYDYDKAEIVLSNLHNEYTGFKKIRGSK